MTEPRDDAAQDDAEQSDAAGYDAAAAEATGVAGADQAGTEIPMPEAVPLDRAVQVEAELAELKDRYLRLAAEYDNFRKRTLRERDEVRLRGQADVARRLLEALDDLGRVADLDPAATAAGDVIAGVELVERKILRELEAVGMAAISAVNVPFDPHLHEAITTIPTADQAEDHTVAAVLQVGYRFNGTLLRPARVQVRMYTPAD